MTIVKICGITNLDDALSAVAAGADLLGFNFYGRSPRYISPVNARQIISQLPARVGKVGVFVNCESSGQVVEIAHETGIDTLQLHGDETPDYCRSLSNWNTIKVVSVKDELGFSRLAEYDVGAFMVDARDPVLRGGTGRVADWSIARKVRELVPRLFLAGGLSGANVCEAISSVNPYAVDACSLIEDFPGKKNERLMREFIEAAHAKQNSDAS